MKILLNGLIRKKMLKGSWKYKNIKNKNWWIKYKKKWLKPNKFKYKGKNF